ncbi:MAG TPA: patatin-like phospholipase family protein [Thermoanaerobaculia bacterium]|nr:patatin-like phospholipase family protein [Thermoanaerobaculia bacterium]
MSWLSRFWRRLKLLYLYLLPIRFSILALAVASFAFIIADQGQDILRRLGEVDPATRSAHWGAIAVFLLLMNLLAYQIWFWARQMLQLEPPRGEDDRYFGRPPSPEEDPELRAWGLWLPRILGALLFVAMFIAFFRVRRTYGSGVNTVIPTILILIAASFVLFLVLVVLRRRWLDKKNDGSIEHRAPGQLAPSTRVIFILFLILDVIFFIFSTVSPTRLMGFGAGAVVLLTLALWVPFGSLIVYWGIRMRVPILTFLIIEAFLVSPLADRNHIVRSVPGSLPARPTVEQKFDEWVRTVAPPTVTGKVPVFIVATEGGGIRAAYWTAAVLDSLQDTVPQFRRNLFAISGVSGGSLGTLTFTALLSDGRGDLHVAGSKALGADFLTPTLAAMAQSDFVQRFLPVGFPDRERALEEAWEAGYDKPTFAGGLLGLYAKHPELPSVFINGTMVETGDRIITSNCQIRNNIVFRDAFDGFDLLKSDIPLSAAAGMSARFTYVSPAGRLGTLGHVVDGGYFENSGAVTAAELVQLVVQRQRTDPRLEPVVILIDYENCSPTLKKLPPDCRFDDFHDAQPVTQPADPQAAERWANEVLSPLRALLATRGARGRQAVGDVRTTSQFSGVPDGVIEFRLVQREVSMPLGWVLSYQAQKAIDGGVESKGNITSRNTVARWLGPQPAASDPMAVQSNQQLQQVNTTP